MKTDLVDINDTRKNLRVEIPSAVVDAQIERIARKAEVTYVVANNHFQAKAGVNALQLKHMITGQRVKATEVLLQNYPELKTFADPIVDDETGQDLFRLA